MGPVLLIQAVPFVTCIFQTSEMVTTRVCHSIPVFPKHDHNLDHIPVLLNMYVKEVKYNPNCDEPRKGMM